MRWIYKRLSNPRNLFSCKSLCHVQREFDMISIKIYLLICMLALTLSFEFSKSKFLNSWIPSKSNAMISKMEKYWPSTSKSNFVKRSQQDLKNYFLSIKDSPPKFVEARLYGKMVLECSAHGNPSPRISWHKNGLSLENHGKIKIVSDNEDSLATTNSKYILDCISEEDAGLYECVADNNVHRQSIETEVHVVSSPVNDCEVGGAGSAPVIHEWMTTYLQLIGNDGNLVCQANGDHSTFWIGPHENIIEKTNSKYQITNNGDLVIHKLSFNDLGIYKCFVKNTNGEDMKETFVYPLSSE